MTKNSLKIVLLILILIGMGSQARKSAAQTNLLQNPGFELPYNGDGSANGWGRWFRVSSADKFDDCAKGYHKEPHWSAETISAPLINSGSASQHVGNSWDTWAAGVLQTVNVKPGSTYRFTVWARGRGSNDNYPAPSEGGLRMDVQVGIDPNGSGLWNDGDVKWSGFIQPHDQWQQVSVEVTATGDKVSVFTAADYGLEGVNQCRAHLDVWFDTAELVEVGPPPTNTPVPQPTSPPPPPPPPATSTSIPTATLVPTETAVPTEVPTNTPEAPAGATVCVNAFADDNGNGQLDANEGFMGSVAFRVASGTQVIGQAVSTGTSEAVCFENLEAGAYEIEQIVPGPLEMTTAANTTVTVAEGQTAGVQFGSRLRVDSDESDPDSVADAGDATVEPTAATDALPETVDTPDEGFSLASYSGLILLVVAVILLGGLLFLVLRRTA